MSPGVTLADRAQILSEVERLVSSHTLHGSESLCKLLRYLAKQAVEHPGIPVKEYQIATEVFGRQADFDPQLDSMVRVQAGRLRSKLAEYYGTEGTSDRLVIELPKGSYAITFHERSGAAGTPGNGAAASASFLQMASDHNPEPQSPSYALPVLGTALFFAVLAIGWLLWTRHGPAVSSAGPLLDSAVPAPIE